jgi:hypothetical protein
MSGLAQIATFLARSSEVPHDGSILAGDGCLRSRPLTSVDDDCGTAST